MDRKETLRTAEKMVCGHRETDYGSPEDSFARIAKLWSAYMDTPFTAHDVAMLMSLLKVARIKNGSAVEDSYVDACGYVACAAEIAENNINKAIKHARTGKYPWGEVDEHDLNGFDVELPAHKFERIIGVLEYILDEYKFMTVADFLKIVTEDPKNISDDHDGAMHRYGWDSLNGFHAEVDKTIGVAHIQTTAPKAVISNARDDTK